DQRRRCPARSSARGSPAGLASVSCCARLAGCSWWPAPPPSCRLSCELARHPPGRAPVFERPPERNVALECRHRLTADLLDHSFLLHHGAPSARAHTRLVRVPIGEPFGSEGSQAFRVRGNARLGIEERMALRLIIADDDALARALIEAIVERDSELCGRHKPDVAVLDWVMPGGGGELAARAILERSPGTKIVALTAPETRPAEIAVARTALAKGAPPEELLRTIRAAADR